MDENEDDRLAVEKLVHRAVTGNRRLTERGTGYLDETILIQCLVQGYSSPVQDNFQSILEQAKLRLDNCQQRICGPADTTKDRLQWRVRFILCCIEILRRERVGKGNDRQRRDADSALIVNSIVNRLIPRFGAYSLAIYSILEGIIYALIYAWNILTIDSCRLVRPRPCKAKQKTTGEVHFYSCRKLLGPGNAYP